MKEAKKGNKISCIYEISIVFIRHISCKKIICIFSYVVEYCVVFLSCEKGTAANCLYCTVTYCIVPVCARHQTLSHIIYDMIRK